MLRKAMEVLGLFVTRRVELGVLEVAEALHWPRSSTSRILSAMAAAGFLDRDAGPRPYRIGARLAALGIFAQQSTSFQQLARPALERLRAETGETASLAVLAGKQMVDIEVLESTRRVKHSDWVGRHGPLHATAAGKALLAWMSNDDVKKRVTPLTRYTADTITRLPDLLRDLRKVRDRGYALAVRELEDDLVAVAAPIRNHNFEILGVIAIGAPASRVPKSEIPNFVNAVMEAAKTASEALSFWPVAGPEPLVRPPTGRVPLDRGELFDE